MFSGNLIKKHKASLPKFKNLSPLSRYTYVLSNQLNSLDNIVEAPHHRSTSENRTSKNEHHREPRSEKRETSLKESVGEIKKQRGSSKKKVGRTESHADHREKKKEKKCKRCKSHVNIGDLQRTCYSDSELDCGNGTSKLKSSKLMSAPFATDSDVSAMCHVFSTKGVNILDSSQSTKGSKTKVSYELLSRGIANFLVVYEISYLRNRTFYVTHEILFKDTENGQYLHEKQKTKWKTSFAREI